MQRNNPSPHRLLLPALAAALLLAALPAHAQQQADSCLRRTVFVNILDREGAPLKELDSGHFKGSLRGKPVQILSLHRDSQPRRIVLLLDASGSMLLNGLRWRLAIEMANRFLALTSAESPLTLAVFGAQPDEKIEVVQERDAIRERLAILERGVKAFTGKKRLHRSALLDAISQSLALLDSPQAGDSIYLLTDGEENASRSKVTQVEESLRRTGVRIFVSLIHPFELVTVPLEYPFRSAIPAPADDPLQWGEPARQVGQLVAASGGTGERVLFVYPEGTPRQALDAEDEAALERILRQRVQEITEFHVMEIELPQEVDKPREWKLELVPREGVKVKDLRVVYPRKLLPCTP